MCLDEANQVWIMLHSGSRGIGNAIGHYFIDLARKDMERWFIPLPDRESRLFPGGQRALPGLHRGSRMGAGLRRRQSASHAGLILAALKQHLPPFEVTTEAVNCHHNHVAREHHYGENVWITREGAIRAREEDMSLIPGSMGAKSYILGGKGNPESFCSSAHGAGRKMSRAAADLTEQTEGIVCRKDIDTVMANRADLVKVVHTLKQVVYVKG